MEGTFPGTSRVAGDSEIPISLIGPSGHDHELDVKRQLNPHETITGSVFPLDDALKVNNRIQTLHAIRKVAIWIIIRYGPVDFTTHFSSRSWYLFHWYIFHRFLRTPLLPVPSLLNLQRRLLTIVNPVSSRSTMPLMPYPTPSTQHRCSDAPLAESYSSFPQPARENP